MSGSQTKEVPEEYPEPMDTSGPSQEASASRSRLNIVPIPGSVATNAVDAVLEAHSLMTTQQAYHFLRSIGVSRDTILDLSQYGLSRSMEGDGVSYHLPSQADADVEDLVALLSQAGWERKYPGYIASTSQPRPPGANLMPMTFPVHYNDLDANVQRYAPHLRPGVIPPYQPVVQNPLTLRVLKEPGAKGFKQRDPNIVIIYVVGPPGSGKTRVSELICEKYNFIYIGVAEILQRESNNPKSPYRHVLADMLPKGLLGPYKMVPSILISEIVREMSRGFKQVFVIDGFPRCLDRAQYFEEMMQPCDQVINLMCEDEIAFNRMMMDCPDRDLNSAELTEKFKNRLAKYRKEIFLVEDYYRRLGKIMSIDAEVPFNNVQQQFELKLKELTIKGIVGDRKETADERNQKAWEEMRQIVEKQYINRAYSFTAMEAREGYDPTIDDSDVDEEMNDDDDDGEEVEEEEGEGEEVEVSEAVPLVQSQDEIRFQPVNAPAKQPTVVIPHRSPQLDRKISPEHSEDANQRVQGEKYSTANRPKSVPEGATRAYNVDEGIPSAIEPSSTVEPSFAVESSPKESESDSSMRTKNAGKTPGPKAKRNPNQWPLNEPSESTPAAPETYSPQQSVAPTSSGFVGRFKALKKKISGTLSSGSESGTSGGERLRSKLSFPSMRRKKKEGKGKEKMQEGSEGEGSRVI
ncbi:adenylate kinase [Arthrobotrys megalospora]